MKRNGWVVFIIVMVMLRFAVRYSEHRSYVNEVTPIYDRAELYNPPPHGAGFFDKHIGR